MFGTVHVLLPISDQPPAAAISESLAAFRWLGSWPAIEPGDTLDLLGLSAGAPWKEAAVAAYERVPDHRAAGVAYHH